MAGKFEVHPKGDKFSWRLKDEDDEVVATGSDSETKLDAKVQAKWTEVAANNATIEVVEE